MRRWVRGADGMPKRSAASAARTGSRLAVTTFQPRSTSALTAFRPTPLVVPVTSTVPAGEPTEEPTVAALDMGKGQARAP